MSCRFDFHDISNTMTDRKTNESVPDLSRRKLSNHCIYGGGGSAGPWMGLLFGLLFIAVGTGVILLAAGVIPSDEANFHAPRWLVGVIGGLFAAAGSAVMSGGALAMYKQGLLKRDAVRYPDQPWLADYHWDTGGSRDDGNRQMTKAFMGAFFFTALMVPFNWLIFFSNESIPFFVHGIVLLFDVITLAIWCYAFYLLGRRVKYGDSRIIFDQFPFHLGEMLSVRWSPSRALGNYNRITFTLRCVEEVEETTGSGKHRQTRVVPYQVWAEQFVVDQPGRHEGLYDVPVAFLLPADGRPTKLSASPAEYWEIEIHADTPGIDFKANYLIPVYSR